MKITTTIKSIVTGVALCSVLVLAAPLAMAEKDYTTTQNLEIPKASEIDTAFADTLSANTADLDSALVAESEPFQHGKATFYAKSWHGRRTSSGERLDNTGYQCAHRTLPFGTLIKVTNKKNGKSCIVKVVDRGPFGKGKVIDLTYQAARDLGMLMHGVVPVSLEKVHPEANVENGQIASSRTSNPDTY